MTGSSGSPESQWLLAIDSSSEQASVALYDGTRVAEVTWLAGRDQTATLLGEIDRLFSLMRIGVAEIAAVAVAIGPGMFNGLRVGMSAAKGFVLGLDVPLIGVSTLDIAAHPFAGLEMPVLATVAAGRGRLVWAEYRSEPSGYRQTVSPRNATVEELAEHAASIGPCLVTGELSADQERAVRATGGVKIPPASGRLRRASALAELAWVRLQNGDLDDAVELEPVYVHAAKQSR
ncbi:MAG: tRNA threonylcarbamoyladenosine biosynthesis protein TsaB [Thermomicrobiales bacterium]|jgi:tRNA threonylcarbamoyladenosine biosynthesis protein TsaB|nr:tRNA threonylcarbamoyladenosine biosynthesis protein TsaB [Thermomicrobiales bacterium]